jgi:hypothetical protein
MDKLVEVIFNEQCKYSRCAVLADFPDAETTNPPYLSVYGALRVKNWNVKKDPTTGKDVLQWVVLDESDYVNSGINSEYRHRIRVCALDEKGDYFTQTFDISEYITGDGQIPDLIALDMIKPGTAAKYPMYKQSMSKAIPLVFINATDISETPQLPIINTISEKALAIYRGEADYRQALFMQGQATPTFSGVSPEEAGKFLLGASGGVASQNKDFKAAFMEVDGNGLSEMRESQGNLHTLAVEEGTKLLNAGANESGEAMKERVASQTVSLSAIASTCETGLIKLFNILREWGNITQEVEITLNREFTSGSATPDGLVKLMQAWTMGAPISKQDIHEWAREGGLSETAWEDIEEEADMAGRNVVPVTK